MTEDQILDQETVQGLRELAGDDATFLPEMVKLFLASLREKIPAVVGALAAGHMKEVASCCHLLKSSAGNLGALALARSLDATESAALANDAALASRTFNSATTQLPAVEAALQKLLG